jgi:hypothetical protein
MNPASGERKQAFTLTLGATGSCATMESSRSLWERPTKPLLVREMFGISEGTVPETQCLRARCLSILPSTP